MSHHRSAQARRLYLHHKDGGKLTDNDVSRLVAYIEELEGIVDEKAQDLIKLEKSNDQS